MSVDFMMVAGADIIFWVALQHLKEFRKTRRARPLIVAVVTLPVAFFLLGIAFGGV